MLHPLTTLKNPQAKAQAVQSRSKPCGSAHEPLMCIKPKNGFGWLRLGWIAGFGQLEPSRWQH